MAQEGERLLHSPGIHNAEQFALSSISSLSQTIHNGMQKVKTGGKKTSQGFGKTFEKNWHKLSALLG
jgi:hypothetical protein